ncbi:MAG: hypothetical protein HFF78_06345, partial [Oscillospiraceae bacterium]|nr:hypothetical protein [Oscillospiraceae bacterium]
MDKTYNWLYREYTLPLLSDMAEEQGKLLRDLTYSLPLTTGDRLDVYDTLTLFRHNWGMEAFALGATDPDIFSSFFCHLSFTPVVDCLSLS